MNHNFLKNSQIEIVVINESNKPSINKILAFFKDETSFNINANKINEVDNLTYKVIIKWFQKYKINIAKKDFNFT